MYSTLSASRIATSTTSYFRHLSTTTSIFTLLLLLAATGQAQNFGDLLVTPMRVVFEGADRSQTLTLFNVGGDTATFDISMIQYRMNEDGTFTEISSPDSGQAFSDPYIRFFPRSVTLPPRQAQMLRVQYRPTASMPDAEYRSHLFFRSVPRKKALEDVQSEDSTALAVRVAAIYGVSIPAIVRKGDLLADVLLDQMALSTLEDSARSTVLSLRLNRSGSMSTYGDITVTFQPRQGDAVTVGTARGIAVYTPNAYRDYVLPLRLPAGLTLTDGQLHVEYSNHSDLKTTLLAERTLDLR